MLGENQQPNAECRMRNAELICRQWLDRPHSRFDLGTAIPHSALRIPHFPLLNELNFARFDAKLEQRLAQVKSDLVKWMFVFWAPTALGVVSLLLLRR